MSTIANPVTNGRHPDLTQLRANPIWEHKFIKKETEILHANGPYNLDNPVHHLWRWKAFRDYSDDYEGSIDDPQYDYTLEFYQRIRPALQLATIYLHRAAPHFIRLARAPVLKDPFGSQYFDPDWRPRNVDYIFFNMTLDALATEYRILHRPPFIDRAPSSTVNTGFTSHVDSWAWGSTTTGFNEDDMTPKDVFSTIAAEVMAEFDANSWNEKSDFQKACMFVMLATTLVHELAHALLGHRRLRAHNFASLEEAQRYAWDDEPSMWPEQWREVGVSLELFLCGSYTCFPYGQYLTRWDIEAGLQWPQARGPVFDGTLGLTATLSTSANLFRGAAVLPISVHTVFSYFDKQTWAAPRQTLHLIDNGPNNFFVPAFPGDSTFNAPDGDPGVRTSAALLDNMRQVNRLRQGMVWNR